MVPSHAESRATLLAIACFAAALLAPRGTPAAVEAAAADNCTVDTSNTAVPNFCAASLEYQPNRIILTHIDMAQGNMRIKADHAEATGPDQDPFKDSHWVFTGNVQVWMPQGHLQADRAEAQISGGRISSTSASGKPAQFEQSTPAGVVSAHGHADDIRYNVAGSEIQLDGDAWLTNGCNELYGERITYDMANQHIQADSRAGGNQRIRGTIRPQCKPTAPVDLRSGKPS